MNKRRIWQAIILVAVVSLAVAVVAQQDRGVGKVRTITLIEKVRVGDALLPAGDYRVKHEMTGTDHILVFTAENNPKIAVQVSCKMVQLPKKADRSEQEFVVKGRERVLTALIFKGDTFRHEL